MDALRPRVSIGTDVTPRRMEKAVMAKLTVGTGGVDIPDGAYEATLLEVEVCEPTDKSPNKKPWLKWTFTVYDGSPEGIEMTAASSTALGPKAKARPWVEAIF